jgi:hypothetical protein
VEKNIDQAVMTLVVFGVNTAICERKCEEIFYLRAF